MNESFGAFWRDLCEYYDYKNGTNKRIASEYRDVCRDVPSKNEQDLFQEIVESCKYFPKIPDFKEICRKFIPESTAKNTEYCMYCLNSGLLPYKRHEQDLGYDSILYAACPKCELGRSFANRYVRFYDEIFGDEGLREVYEKHTDKPHVSVEEVKKEFFEAASKIGAAM